MIEAYQKITPSDELKSRILAEKEKKQETKDKNFVFLLRPAFACVACIILTIVGIGLIQPTKDIRVTDQNGMLISSKERKIESFNIEEALKNDTVITPMTIRMSPRVTTGVVLDIVVKESTDIKIEEGTLFLVENGKVQQEIGQEYETDQSIQICWAFGEMQDEKVETKMVIQSTGKTTTINLKYENGVFYTFIS